MSSLRLAAKAAFTLTAAMAATLALAAIAHAGSTHYCTGNLNAGYGCGDGNAHAGNLYVEIVTNHTGCAALSEFGGYNPLPIYGDTLTGIANITAIACTNGSGTNGGSAYAQNAYHGAVWNPNQSTTDYVYDAHISW